MPRNVNTIDSVICLAYYVWFICVGFCHKPINSAHYEAIYIVSEF